MSTSIIGYGVLGKGMYKIFPDALIQDPHLSFGVKKDKIPFDDKESVNKTKLGIICVPTPIAKDGWSCDTSIVEEVIEWLQTPLILIKSTVSIGTTDRLKKKYKKRIVFSPEYIGESKYYTPPEFPDPANPKQHGWITLGGESKDTQEAVDIFEERLGPTTHYIQLTAKEAETAKYLENVYFASKVTLVNEFYECCNALGVNWSKVREAWLQDSRICRMHTSVFKNKRGFAGKCYEKDLRAFIKTVKDSGYETKLLKEVIETNDRMRGLNSK